jgi:2-keto-3-deoxy-L-rhamnonate aldolase RhmA
MWAPAMHFRSRAIPFSLALLGTLTWGCGGDPGRSSEASNLPPFERLNPMIALHEGGIPVFGLYAPRATPPRNPVSGSDAVETRTPADIAAEAVGYPLSDFLFYSEMEGGVDGALPGFQALVSALKGVGASALTHPIVVKMEKISEDPDAVRHIGQQLNSGVSGVMFVEVESAEELKVGLDAMRFQSRGGTRDESGVGTAPEYWGRTEAEYRESADLWPLNPQGELVAWVIIESLEGLANVREIAAVPGIGVLWPGAGTLRGIFTSTDADGSPRFDEEAWERAIQSVLSACKEFQLHCGFPANPDNIETRMAQGFDVFVMGWGEAGFRTVELGRELFRR